MHNTFIPADQYSTAGYCRPAFCGTSRPRARPAAWLSWPGRAVAAPGTEEARLLAWREESAQKRCATALIHICQNQSCRRSRAARTHRESPIARPNHLAAHIDHHPYASSTYATPCCYSSPLLNINTRRNFAGQNDGLSELASSLMLSTATPCNCATLLRLKSAWSDLAFIQSSPVSISSCRLSRCLGSLFHNLRLDRCRFCRRAGVESARPRSV